ncbi:MAG: DUF2399 domain-containing protein [Propionicimonas sp.]|uniref:DUF2399 domain-containing protein n=1 Tax=Propionicimonas sp. TaxID=1955623 RepID=UPI002B22113A|nr:DUF2399 domain-containing protein [Propionicimonas sp.]MEA4945712.1 DUF2399 domain-containing protein [Propionicimonas sp.]MEA5053071.1 DUF2399 domain-containing protein [Propionicimonas sp.]
MNQACPWCDGGCADADLEALLTPELEWLWRAVAAVADRRGDPRLTSGSAIRLTLPAGPAERAAVAGLVVGTRAGQTTSVRPEQLLELVRRRSATLTPGAVAAHSVGRRVGQRTARRVARQARQDALLARLAAAWASSPALGARIDHVFEQLRQTGWVARLASSNSGEETLAVAADVVRRVCAIPEGERFDRRLLVPSDPHALDDGTRLASLTLAIIAGLGLTSAGRPREQWSQVGVDCDDLLGGLILLGIAPLGWDLPRASVVTIPPRELAVAQWPAASPQRPWAFVTENPSVLAAAAERAASEPGLPPLQLICTVGTPSAIEIAAIDTLARAGWKVAVRADFDAAGLHHVKALLAGIRGSVPWRMAAADYSACAPSLPARSPVPDTPWDPGLADALRVTGKLAFEEAMLPSLLDDLVRGRPDH